MKYVIPNERLKSLMTDRLNAIKNENRLSRIGTFIIIYKENDDVFSDYEEVIIEYDFSDGRLFVIEDIFYNFISWFPIDTEDAKKFIIDWFEKTYDVDVAYIRVL
jgi:hypothetical protein